jgi:hypothetical protein
MNENWQHLGAFVLQFRGPTDIAASRFEGRVEHVASGRQTRFHSLTELRAFVEQVMQNLSAETREVERAADQ